MKVKHKPMTPTTLRANLAVTTMLEAFVLQRKCEKMIERK